MFGLAVAVAIFDLVVVAVLAIPVSLVVDIERTDRLRSRLRVNWLFGLVDVELGQGQPRRAPPARPSTKARKPRRSAFRPARLRLGRGPAIALALVRTDGLPGASCASSVTLRRVFRSKLSTCESISGSTTLLIQAASTERWRHSWSRPHQAGSTSGAGPISRMLGCEGRAGARYRPDRSRC